MAAGTRPPSAPEIIASIRKGYLMTSSNHEAGARVRMAWQRPAIVRMGAADAEGTTAMSMIPDATRPNRMMGS